MLKYKCDLYGKTLEKVNPALTSQLCSSCGASNNRFGLSTFEWIAVILCIGAVLAAEGVNSAIEALCDKVSPEYDEAIKHTKDLAAGAVLILAVMSVIVGLLIFVPKVLSLFH